MNALFRFLSSGMQDADRRIAAALQPSRLESVDRYLANSSIIKSIDRLTRRLELWWLSSNAWATVTSVVDGYSRDWPVAYRDAALVLLVAVAVHVALTTAHGLRPGWYWTLIPAMTAVFAIMLLTGSRSVRKP